MDDLKKKKEMRLYLLFILCLGVGMFFFFAIVHPLYIYDTDDWTYISFSRHAWPSIRQFNPAKVLPETLMPITAQIGVSMIMPFTGDYILSMTYAFSVCLVIFIEAYILQMGKTVSSVTGIGNTLSIPIMGIFLLYHFLPYNHGNSGTKHLLYGGSVNCTYNYLIPALLNAALALYLMRRDSLDLLNGEEVGERKDKYLRNGFFILICYLALNSNMFHSIILSSFAGAHIIISFVQFLKRCADKTSSKNKLRNYIIQNKLWLAIDIAWSFVLIFESRGSRAAKETGSLLELPIGETFKQFIASVNSMNRIFLLTITGFIITGVILAVYRCRNEVFHSENKANDKTNTYLETMLLLLVSFLITLVYLILLCAKVSPHYMSNNIVEISWIFWFMTSGFLSFGYVLSNASKTVLILPVFLYVLACEVIVDGGIYAENNTAYLTADIVKALDDNLIRQVKEAEEAGLSDVVVKIPLHPSQEWPMNTSYGGSRIATSLYKHGIIRSRINITLEPNQEINDEFGIRQ